MSAIVEALPTSSDTFPLGRRLPSWSWLLLGILVTTLVGNRFNVALLGWVAAVPWLLYLRRTGGWRSRLLFAVALQLGTFGQVVKIVTEPIPWFFALMFSVPTALATAILYSVFEALRRRLGDLWGLLLFPALVVASEWAGANSSAMGSWGALAYSQLDNPALMQSVSLFGLGTVSLLLALVSALSAVLLDSDRPARWIRAVLVVAALVLAAHTFGAVRLYTSLPGPLITVAAVSSDVGPGPDGLPSVAELRAANDALFERTAAAAEQGAQLVVWNEGATVVEAAAEEALVARAEAIASAHATDIVLAYIVPLDGLRRFENKYVWVTPDGVAETYLKHHPVPSEGSIRGTDPVRVLERPYGRAAGAICYDYDYPALAREHAVLGAGIVAVPSSDWRGIDPYHTQMARVRGIEGGFSVVRSVRWATSGAFDALGRARATASYSEGERTMIARVPATQIATLYARVGDLLPAFSGGLLLAGGGLVWLRRAKAAASSS